VRILIALFLPLRLLLLLGSLRKVVVLLYLKFAETLRKLVDDFFGTGDCRENLALVEAASSNRRESLSGEAD